MAGDELCCAQAQHGSAPDIENQDKANPTSMILSVAMLLDWIGAKRHNAAFAQAGQAMHAAVEVVLANPDTRTPDIGGRMGTQAFAKAVVQAI
jgi:3-isopropylmalate dehydrogenase